MWALASGGLLVVGRRAGCAEEQDQLACCAEAAKAAQVTVRTCSAAHGKASARMG